MEELIDTLQDLEDSRIDKGQGILKVLSYNVFMRPPMISSDKYDDHKDLRLDLMKTIILPHYDIIGLQEIFPKWNSRRSKLIQEAKKHDLRYSSVPPDQPICSCFFVNSGLLTLSKNEIVSSKFYGFKKGTGPDALAYKGVLFSEICTKRSRIHLFNTHLQANYHDQDHKNISNRFQQFNELRDIVDRVLLDKQILGPGIKVMEDDMILIMGDLNVCQNKGVFKKKDYHYTMLKNEDLRKFADTIDEHHFSEYEYMMEVLSKDSEGNRKYKVIDHIYERFGHRPATNLDSIHYYKNVELDMPDPDLYSLDYIIQLVPVGTEASSLPLAIPKESVKIMPFKLENHPCNYLSDHFGVEFSIVIK